MSPPARLHLSRMRGPDMNPLLVRLGEAATRRGTIEGVSLEFRELYPVLSEIMAGVESQNGFAAVPALGLRLFWQGGRLTACCSRYKHPTCLWLTVTDETKALESIELTLAQGGGDIRPSKQW